MDASQRKWSYGIWGAWLTSFAALELLAFFNRAPWRTLSTTIWSLEGRWSFIRVITDGGLAILRTHIVNPNWPDDSR